MTRLKIAGRIALRCLLEFGPPTVAGIAWALGNKGGTVAGAVANFSAAFVTVGIVWSSFLRIQYQQTTRAHQENAADEFRTIKSNLDRVEGALQELSKVIAIQGTLSPEQSKEVVTALNQANSTISSANNTITVVAHSMGAHALVNWLRGQKKD